MAAKKDTATTPANETREQRLARLRKVAATKELRVEFWPGNNKVRKGGMELLGTLVDVREREKQKFKGAPGEKVSVSVATVRGTDDSKMHHVELNGQLRNQFAEQGLGIGDEVLFLFRGKNEEGYNQFAVELVTRAGES